MKNLSIFLMLVWAFAAQAMDDKIGQGVPAEGSKSRPIVIDDDNEEDTRPVTGQSSQKRAKITKAKEGLATDESSQKKELSWSPEPPKREKKSRAFLAIHDEQFILEPMCSSAYYIKNIRIIFDDAEMRGIKEIAGYSKDLAFKLVRRMQEKREYALDVDFGRYRVRSPTIEITIGGVYFPNFVPVAVGEGVLEVQFHLISEFNGKGIGHAILVRLISDLIKPKLGQKCSFMKTIFNGELPADAQANGYFESLLKGCYAKKRLVRATAFDSCANIKSHAAAGFGAKVSGRELILCYPPDSFPPGPPLEPHEVESLMRIAQTMSRSLDHKMKLNLQKEKEIDSVPQEVDIGLQEILRAPKVYGKAAIEPMRKLYLGLLSSSEPYTFLSVLDILYTDFRMTLEDLKCDIPPERALQMIKVIESRIKPVPDLYFLREFTKPY